MKQSQVQTTQDTNLGTSDSSSQGSSQKPFDVQDKRETISEFLVKVDRAKMDRQEWVEASPEIINYYLPRGLGNTKYFIFQGIKVAPTGTIESAQNSEDEDLSTKVFGPSECVVLGRG